MGGECDVRGGECELRGGKCDERGTFGNVMWEVGMWGVGRGWKLKGGESVVRNVSDGEGFVMWGWKYEG